jgi:serine/threonine protein phosphatase PrpC
VFVEGTPAAPAAQPPGWAAGAPTMSGQRPAGDEEHLLGPPAPLAEDEQVAAGTFPGGAFALVSLRGAVRPWNEDRAGTVLPPARDPPGHPPLFVVADGLGGHQAGEVAAELAVSTTLAVFPRAAARPRQALRAATRQAALAVYDAGFEPGRSGMATTLTALTFDAGEVVVAHVGDTRCYRWREGAVEQLTTDHSQVADLVRLGLLTPEQAARHPGRSILTRCLGTAPGPPLDLVRRGLRAGDRLVLCSDGLWGLVERAEVAEAVRRFVPGDEAERAVDLDSLATRLGALVDHLAHRALARGAPDNVTVLAVALEPGCPWLEAPSPRRRRWPFSRGS